MFLVSLSGEGRGGLGSWSQLDVSAFPCSLVFEFDKALSLVQPATISFYSIVLYPSGQGGRRLGDATFLTPHCLLQGSQNCCWGRGWVPHFGQAQPGWERGVPDLGVSSKDPIPTPTNSSDCGDSLPLRVSLLPSEMHGLGAMALTLIPCQ